MRCVSHPAVGALVEPGATVPRAQPAVSAVVDTSSVSTPTARHSARRPAGVRRVRHTDDGGRGTEHDGAQDGAVVEPVGVAGDERREIAAPARWIAGERAVAAPTHRTAAHERSPRPVGGDPTERSRAADVVEPRLDPWRRAQPDVVEGVAPGGPHLAGGRRPGLDAGRAGRRAGRAGGRRRRPARRPRRCRGAAGRGRRDRPSPGRRRPGRPSSPARACRSSRSRPSSLSVPDGRSPLRCRRAATGSHSRASPGRSSAGTDVNTPTSGAGGRPSGSGRGRRRPSPGRGSPRRSRGWAPSGSTPTAVRW